MRYRYYKGRGDTRHCWNTTAIVPSNPTEQFVYFWRVGKNGGNNGVQYFQRRKDAKGYAFGRAMGDNGADWGLRHLPSESDLRLRALKAISRWLRDNGRDSDAALAEMQMGAVKVKLKEKKEAAKAEAAAAKPDIRQVKIKMAGELVKKWERRFKLAKTKLKKAQSRLKRLERTS